VLLVFRVRQRKVDVAGRKLIARQRHLVVFYEYLNALGLHRIGTGSGVDGWLRDLEARLLDRIGFLFRRLFTITAASQTE
jgi:hypothetical protein